MTVKETKSFMEEIKAFYPNFQIETYLIDQWSSQLKECSLLKVKEFFENHKRGSLKEKEPNLRYFVYCFENSKKNKPGNYRCRYCGKGYNDLDSLHKCQDLCRSKQYINRIADTLGLDILEIFGTKDLTQEIVDKFYKRFMYKAFVRQKETGLLNDKTANGLAIYYRQVLKPALEKKEANS